MTGDFCTKWNERESTGRKSWSCRSRGNKPEQIVTMLRQIEGKHRERKNDPTAQISRFNFPFSFSSSTIQSFYRWRKDYGGLKMDQAKMTCPRRSWPWLPNATELLARFGNFCCRSRLLRLHHHLSADGNGERFCHAEIPLPHHRVSPHRPGAA